MPSEQGHVRTFTTRAYKRYIIKTFYRRPDSSDRVRLPQDKLLVFLVDRFSYRVPRVAIFLLWKYPLEVEESREKKKERKKKEERKRRKSIQQPGDHLRESDLNTGCRLLNSRTVSIHSRGLGCVAPRVRVVPQLPRSKTKRSPRALEINTKYTWCAVWDEISSRARSARIGGPRTGFSRDE